MRRSRSRSPLLLGPGPRERGRRGALAPLVRRLVVGGVGLAVAALIAIALWGGSGRPTATLATPLEVVGRRTPVAIDLRAGRSGLRSFEVLLEAPSGGGARTLAAGELPTPGWLAGGVREHRLELEIDAEALGLGEGETRLTVLADEHAPLSRLRGRTEALSAPLRIDLTPPRLAPRTGPQVVSAGGSGIVVYEVSEDAVRSEVLLGDQAFPGHAGAVPGSPLRVALFAAPLDAKAPVRARLGAVDAVGNRREIPLSITIKPKAFPAEEIVLTDRFLSEKIPDLLAANGLAPAADPVESYLVVNRELRRRTEERVRALTRDSSPAPLFDGPFLQQPGTAVGSRFAEHRTYRYNGRVIDEQTHLGTDLASVKQDPVVAANAGKVTFVGDLGIYGQTVIVDHGLGLATLYAHLSRADVQPGQSVARGETIARSGETGLAGGDHLHFSTMLAGVHVDPVEWWDGKWIRDHVSAEIHAAAPTPTPAIAPTPSPAAAAGAR